MRELDNATRIALAVFMVILYFMGIKAAYTSESGFLDHFIFAFCHANLIHLGLNLTSLFLFKKRLYIIEGIYISFLASYLPVWMISGDEATMGFSGVLFAIVGIKYGVVFSRCKTIQSLQNTIKINRKAIAILLTSVVITIFIPHLNWCLHLYCLIIGCAYGCIKHR